MAHWNKLYGGPPVSDNLEDEEEMAFEDIGHGVSIAYYSWNDYDKVGLFETHNVVGDEGRRHTGSVMFALPGTEQAFPDRPKWTVESWDPLTISPSILCDCGNHGFIRNGRWVPA
jgi:uncharacterized protein DUF6527